MRAMPADLPIRLDDVTVRAGAVTVLDGVSLIIAPGAPAVLIGPNGSGKTTLLRVAMGLLPPSSGHVTWDGVTEASPARRAIVFQRPVMLRRSVAGNIRYALNAAQIPSDRHDARLAELLSLVGLEALASRPARKLSGGEQQRAPPHLVHQEDGHEGEDEKDQDGGRQGEAGEDAVSGGAATRAAQRRGRALGRLDGR